MDSHPDQENTVTTEEQSKSAVVSVTVEEALTEAAAAVKEENETPEGEKAPQLFVGKVPFTATQDQLKEYFQQFGEIAEIILMKQSKTSPLNKGYAFMRFKTTEATKKAQGMTHKFQGAELAMNEAKPKTIKYFVGGIHRDKTTLESFKAHFEPFGKIEDCVCFPARGFGFVTIQDKGDGALDKLKGSQYITLDDVKVEIKVARPKNQQGGQMGGNQRGGWGAQRGGWGGYQGGYQMRGGYGMRGSYGGRGAYGRGGYNPYGARGGYGRGRGGMSRGNFGRRW